MKGGKGRGRVTTIRPSLAQALEVGGRRPSVMAGPADDHLHCITVRAGVTCQPEGPWDQPDG